MIYLGADHGGFTLKEQVKVWLTESNISFEDLGTHSFDPSDDYPQYAFAVAQKVLEHVENKGILLCRSGGGMTIAANRLVGVRAVDCTTEQCVGHAREDNDVNILSLPADWISESDAKKLIQNFLTTPFSGEERHVRRLQTVDQMAIRYGTEK